MNVMRESACEALPPFRRTPTCNTDQRSFKALMSRFLGATYQLAPFTRGYISLRLRASASGAASSCDGQPGGDTCGLSWLAGKYGDSPYGIAVGGVGEHLAAMEVFQNLLVGDAPLPKTMKTGGGGGGGNLTGGAGGIVDGENGAKALGAGTLAPVAALAGVVGVVSVLL